MTDELTRFRADVPPADPVAMTKARAALVRAAAEAGGGGRSASPASGVAAVAAALFALPSGATRTPAASENGLVHNPDGTITIELREVEDVHSLNMELYEAGVRAVVLDSAFGGVVECWMKYPVTPSRLGRGWVGDTTPGYPNLPPYEGTLWPETGPATNGTAPTLTAPRDIAPSGPAPVRTYEPPVIDHPSPGSSTVPTR